MRIAVCVSGQPRFFKTSYPLLKEFILRDYDCDMFIDTWDYQLPAPVADFDVAASFRYKDEGTLDEYKALYRPKMFKAEPYNKVMESKFVTMANRLNAVKRSDDFVKRYVAMLYKIFTANQLALNSAQKSFKTYDYFIRTRSDLSYNQYLTPELLKEVRGGKMIIDEYGNGRRNGGDVFAIGTKFDMQVYCNLFFELDNYKKQGLEINTEILLPHHLKANNIDYKITRLVDNVLRPKEWYASGL